MMFATLSPLTLLLIGAAFGASASLAAVYLVRLALPVFMLDLYTLGFQGYLPTKAMRRTLARTALHRVWLAGRHGIRPQTRITTR